MKRAWIYQESAFGELCTDTMREMLLSIRGLTGQDHQKPEDMVSFIEACGSVGVLFGRRGYVRRWQEIQAEVSDKMFIGDNYDLSYTLSSRCGWDYNATYKYLTEKQLNFAQTHLIDVLTRDDSDFKIGMEAFLEIMCPKAYTGCKNKNEFFEIFGPGIVEAYLTSSVTYETDRSNAITAVASYIVEKKLNGPKMTAKEIMFSAWKGALMTQRNFSILRIYGKSSCFAADVLTDIKTSTPGWTFAGLGQILGSRVIGNYKTRALRYKGNSNKFEKFPKSILNFLNVRFPETELEAKAESSSAEQGGYVDLFVSVVHQEKVALFVCAPREIENLNDVEFIVSAKATDLKIPESIYFCVGRRELKPPCRDNVLFD